MSSRESTDPSVPFYMSRERKLSMPLAFLLALLASVAAGAVAWSNTRDQVGRNTEDIRDLKTEQRVVRESLSEIKADLKYLVRDKRREDSSK